MKVLLLVAFVVFIIATILQFAHAKPKTWGVVQKKQVITIVRSIRFPGGIMIAVTLKLRTSATF